MKHDHINHHVMHKAMEASKSLAPLEDYKSPAVAAVLGFTLGAIGISVYFKSLTDFVVLSVIWVLCLLFAIPTAGMAALIAPVFCASYGYHRAKDSNMKLGLSR